MPTKITDRRLATLYRRLESQRASNPGVKIDGAQVLKILSEVADSGRLSAAKALVQLRKSTLSRDQQVELIRKGMSAGEKADLATLLDQGTVPLEPSARNFLEAVLERSAVQPGGPLTLTGDQRQGLSGTARAGDSIEAINLSTAPTGRLHMDDTMEIARADAFGKFTHAKLPEMQEGDLVRLRARHGDGTVGDWVTVNVEGTGSTDTRNAQVALFRIGMMDAGGGQVNVTNINASRQVSEPGATLQFTNGRTGEKTQVTVTPEGGFPTGFGVQGKPGDVFTLSASDGKNNPSFTTSAGTVTVPGGTPATGDLIADPALHKDETRADGTARFTKKRFTGPLFQNGASPTDVQQGQLANCYFPSAIASLAQNNAEALENAIRDNGDGTYSVTFKTRDWLTGKYKDAVVKVDGDLHVRSNGTPLYGASSGADKSEARMELWFPLLEKAYASWKGSYSELGNGGSAGAVFESVLGEPSAMMNVSAANADRVWSTLKTELDAKRPLSAGTYGEDQNAQYTNTGIYADHSYSVLGYAERNGVKYVKLRNPWGESEPSGNGPNDGIFELKLQDFIKLYQDLMYVSPS